jgi:hypothetical protein
MTTGIHSFEAFAVEHRLLKSLGISTLQDATVVVDADHFIYQTLSSAGPNRREPLVHAVGGFPSSLESAVTSFVEALAAVNAKPLFVLSGLNLVQTTRPLIPVRSAHRRRNPIDQRNNAWALYEKGQGEQAVLLFDETEPFNLHTGHGSRTFINLLISNKIDFLVAPYTASAQMAYLYQEGYADAIYGSSETLFYRNVDKLIVNVDLNNDASSRSYQWISKKSVLSELGFSHEQFVEAGVAVGCSLTGYVTFPPIELVVTGGSGGITALKVAHDIVQSHGSLYGPVMAFPESADSTPSSSPYSQRFQKALASIDFQPVLKDSGKVEPFQNGANTPNDVHEFIGQRLPDEMYFYVSRGLIGRELLDARTSGSLLEYAPLDGGDCRQYKSFIRGLQDLRTKCLSFLVQTLHRYYQFKDISTITWFDPSRPLKFDRVTPPLYTTVSKPWLLVEGPVESNLGRLILNLEKEHVTAKEAGTRLISDDEIFAKTMCVTLQAADFVSDKHTLTAWGKALAKGLRKSEDLAEPLMVALTLVKDGYLTDNQFDPAYSGGPLRGTPEERKHTLLISRVATHIPLRHKPIGYTGPLSRNLLSYQSFISSQTQTYRWLVESVIVSLFINDNADRLSRENDEQWTSLVKRLPFADIPNIGTGIATKSYLEEVISGGDDIENAKSSFEAMFKQAVDVTADVARGFRLWDALMAAVDEAKSSGIVNEATHEGFASANLWLQSRR